jgi:hypothetical protein
MADVALVGLVDARGWLLLQERDDLFAIIGRTQATAADVVCTEGRQIVFVDPELVPGLDLTGATRASYEDVLAAASRLTR